jgi:hypothetical protein
MKMMRILQQPKLGASVLTIILSGALTVFLAPQAEAGNGGLIFGNLQSARTLGDGVYNFGVGVMPGDDITTVQGSFGYGFSRFVEGRFRLGIADQDGANEDPTIGLGAEVKYQFWNYEGESGAGLDDPFDLSFSGMFEYASFESRKITSIGANVLGSRPYISKQGRRYGPYGRFNVRMMTVDPKSAGISSDTDIEFTITPGFMFQLTDQMTAFVEFNIDDNTGFALGVEFGPF